MNAKKNGHLVEDLGRVFRLGETFRYADVPVMFKRLLADGAWREFQSANGEIVTHDRFSVFLATPPTRGLGVEVDLVRRVIGPDVEALDLLDQALQNPHGTNQHEENNNVQVLAPEGNRAEAALRRLRKDRPDLHEQVLADELSPHAAMVQAGFRPRTVTVRTDRPDAIARTLRRALTDDQIHDLVRLLTGGS